MNNIEGIITFDKKGNLIVADIKTTKEILHQGYSYSFTDGENNEIYEKSGKYAIIQ